MAFSGSRIPHPSARISDALLRRSPHCPPWRTPWPAPGSAWGIFPKWGFQRRCRSESLSIRFRFPYHSSATADSPSKRYSLGMILPVSGSVSVQGVSRANRSKASCYATVSGQRSALRHSRLSSGPPAARNAEQAVIAHAAPHRLADIGLQLAGLYPAQQGQADGLYAPVAAPSDGPEYIGLIVTSNLADRTSSRLPALLVHRFKAPPVRRGEPAGRSGCPSGFAQRLHRRIIHPVAPGGGSCSPSSSQLLQQIPRRFSLFCG